MKKLTTISVAALIACATFSCNKPNTDTTFSDLRDSASYVIGVDFGSQIAQFSQILPDSVNVEALIAGLRDAALNVADTPRISMDDMQRVIEEYQMQQLQKKFKPEIEAGEQFLTENAKREGVKTTESGLQYEVITLGTGETPTQFDEVTLHYHGTKLDGTVFDSSKGAEPVVFNVSQVVPGFSEGLQLLPVGSKFKLFIPQDLAYGVQPPRGSSLKPFETLIFEVELISSKKGEAPKQPQFSLEQLQQMQMQ
ncbi:MAG: FKBP-type peptidyl-prolyl cis-trans isomerase [Bacteroidales bacterium]|jgi:FKBP-type peptidyl-prolyl cis-trans isomerase FklB|nr:FKBP-type peptidyl-prolyl cis-trans isomerase [Bacteroidales bacterium]